MSIRKVVLAAFVVALATGSVPAQEGSERVAGYRERVECMNHLRQIGALLSVRKASGRVLAQPGPAYLLQVAPKVPDGQLGIFVCPGDFEGGYDVRSAAFRKLYRDDWKSAPCSYRGPNRECLERLAKRPFDPVILACDTNGPEGTAPHHPDGVCVLWSNNRVQFLTWADIEGSGGKPCAVGPDSPDPRFRHLVTQSQVAESGGQSAEEGTTQGRIEELESELNRLKEEHQKTLAELRTEIARLRDEVRKLSEKLDLVTRNPPPPAVPKVPRVDAVVTSVDADSGLILLSVGRDGGVRKGMEFTVYRGNQYVGKVVVNEVKPDLSTAISVKEVERMAIRAGDKATTRF